MTREEFHEEVDSNADYIGWHNAHELADKLYDDLDKMTCENCKHNFIDGIKEDYCHMNEQPVCDDFGCNRWVSK